jgi:hypothetical protein
MKWLNRLILAVLIGSNAPAFSQVVLESDDNNATLTGTWATQTTAAGFYGTGYRVAAGGGGSDLAQFLSPKPISSTGSWCLEARWTADTDRATAVQYQVYDYNTLRNTFTVDQTKNGGTWQTLGCVKLTAGKASKVRISDSGVTTGKVVVADGVRWVWDESANIANNPQDYCINVNGGWNPNNPGGVTFVAKNFVYPPKGACRSWTGIVRASISVVGTTTGTACLSDDGKRFTAALRTSAVDWAGVDAVSDTIDLCPTGTCPPKTGGGTISERDLGYFSGGMEGPAAHVSCTAAMTSIPSEHD